MSATWLLALRAPEKLCSHGSRIRSHLWSIATDHKGKKKGKRKNKELDAQTNLPERAIEFFAHPLFLCFEDDRKRERGQNQDNSWERLEDFWQVSWQNMKSGLCVTSTFENNHHSAITDASVCPTSVISPVPASLEEKFLKPVSLKLAEACPGEPCSQNGKLIKAVNTPSIHRYFQHAGLHRELQSPKIRGGSCARDNNKASRFIGSLS